jgi:hypothetical protein
VDRKVRSAASRAWEVRGGGRGGGAREIVAGARGARDVGFVVVASARADRESGGGYAYEQAWIRSSHAEDGFKGTRRMQWSSRLAAASCFPSMMHPRRGAIAGRQRHGQQLR